jgi:hypothetical protein
MKNEVTNNAKQERTRNLCVLTAANLQVMVSCGLRPSMEQAIRDAECMLDRIENGPVEEAETITDS